MPYLILILFSFILLGCASNNDASVKGDFYTWVDERGQLRTVKRVPDDPAKKDNGNLDGEMKEAKSTKPKQKESESLVDFDESNYTPSGELEKQLQGNKLYAWNDGVNQNTLEVLPEISNDSKEIVRSLVRPFSSKSYLHFREGKEILISEIIGQQTQLERLYIFNKKANSDYSLLELDVPRNIDQLNLKSFVSNQRVALPMIVFLDKNYQSVSAKYLPFGDYTDETWASYAHFSGSIALPSSAKYLLVTPNQEVGVAEVGEAIIKMVDLGSILIDF